MGENKTGDGRWRSFGSPARYIQGPGAIAQLLPLLDEFESSRALVVADAFVLNLLCKTVGALETLQWHVFSGECTAAEVARVAHTFRQSGCDLIVGAGGGKSIDAAKGAQIECGCPIFVVPTVASTDGPTSRVVLIYTEEHRLWEMRSMRANPDVVLVDSTLIAQAPRRFFIAGLGDALTKRFETAQYIDTNTVNIHGDRHSGLSSIIGQACFDTLMRDTTGALEAVIAGVPNAAFERVLEATVLLSGLSFENGGRSVAHSLPRGLAAIPEIRGSLHGEEVAFGLLVQLLLERDHRQAQIEQLLPYYRQTGLPMSLEALGVAPWATADAAWRIADITVEASPHLKRFSRPLEAHELAQAIMATAEFG